MEQEEFNKLALIAARDALIGQIGSNESLGEALLESVFGVAEEALDDVQSDESVEAIDAAHAYVQEHIISALNAIKS